MYLEDMGSTNGTYLNGRQVKSAERLKVADVIRIGDSEYRYRGVAAWLCGSSSRWAAATSGASAAPTRTRW